MGPVLKRPYELYGECRDELVQSFDTGAALWAYRLMDRAQLEANLSFPQHMLFFQDGMSPNSRTPSISYLRASHIVQTLNATDAMRLCPVQIRRWKNKQNE